MRLLGQAKLAAQALEPGAEVEGSGISHLPQSVKTLQLYKENL